MPPLAMIRRTVASSIALVTLVVGLVLIPGSVLAQAGGSAYRPGEILIKFKPSTSQTDIHAILDDLGATPITVFRLIGASQERITRLDVAQAIARYQGDPRVQYIEPNYVVHALMTPNDPMFGQMWGLSNTGQTGGTPGADIHATQAWEVSTGSASVLVAIIDTGMDYTHPDLAANVYVNPGEIPGNGVDDDGNGFVDDVHGWNFVNNTNDPMDDNGHGTHVSGTVGAIGNNALGVVGVNWNVRLLPVKFLDSSGSGSTAAAISAIEYATLMGARVMSNSWGGGSYSQAMYDAIKAAGAAGILFVAAAGNAANNNDVNPAYPASYDLPNIISVAASDPNDNLASFSNYGPTSVDLAAPGTDILSTFPGGQYGYLSGTSMATPHVSGAAALVLGRFPALDATGVRTLLLAEVDPVPSLAGKVASGGRLNAFLPLAGMDSIPPAAITDVTVAGVNGDWADLQWTATGDDGTSGTAAQYDLRYSTTPITDASFPAATRATGVPHPLPAGSAEQVRVNGLAFSTTYYFAVKALDELGNTSGISNVVTGATVGPPVGGVAPDSVTADLLTGEKATRVLTISNTGAGELRFKLGAHLLSGPTAPAAAAFRALGSGFLGAGSLGASGSRLAAPARRSDAGSFPSPGPAYDAGHTPGRAPFAAPGLLPPVRPAAVGLRILLLQSGGDVSELQSLLAAFPDVAQVDVFDGGFATPTLAQLSAYNTVVAIANIQFGDPVGVGNVLADFVDSGGGLVLTLATFIHGWEISGRLLSGGYMPFNLGSGPGPASTLGVFDAAHPIMQGVKTAGGDLLGVMTVATGAELVASWASGLPLVATQGKRVAGVNLFFGGPGFWVGDVPLLMHNACFWAGGVPNFVTMDPTAGTVPAGGTAQIQVTLDAARLYGGDYRAEITVESNDPAAPKRVVPAHLHVTGAPDIAVTPASFEFGPVFIGAARPETLTVVNQGTDLLSVSGVTVSPAEFAAPGGAFDLAPGQRQTLIVTFTPANPVVSSGSLTIASNDPDQGSLTVALHGEGLIAPRIAVAPDSVVADLLSGQASTQPVTIRNTGGSDLTFSVGIAPVLAASRAAGAPGIALRGMRPAASGITALLGGPRLAASGGASGAWTGDSQTASPGAAAARARPRARSESVPPPGGNDILVIATAPLTYSLELALQQLGRGYDFMYAVDFTGIDFTPYKTIVVGMDGGAINEASCQALANAAAGGRLLFMAGGTSYAPFYTGLQNYLIGHTGQTGWTTSAPPHLIVNDPSDPLSFGLPSPVTFVNSAASLYMLRISDPAARVAARNGDAQAALVHKAIGAGNLVYLIDSPYDAYWGAPADFAILKQIVQNALAFGSTGWLSVTPRTGTVPAGGEATLQVDLNSAGLNGGDYRANLQIVSNDPGQALVLTPVHMHVTGVPHIAVSKPAIDFGQVFIGVAEPETLVVTNLGTDVLTVSSVAASPADYTAPAGGFSLVPGGTQALAVAFKPGATGPIPGTLEISSNDPATGVLTVALSGVGLVPPSIAVTPSALTASLLSGQQVTQPLGLSNTGGSDLRYSITVVPAQAPAAGPVGAVHGVARGGAGRAVEAPAGARVDGTGLAAPHGPSGLEPLLRHRLAGIGSQFVVFFDDMEHGDNGWTRQVYGVDDLWHRTTRAFNSPVTSWWCGIESTGNYNTGNTIRTAAVSPPIDLSFFRAPIGLEFYESFQTEPYYDNCMVDVSSDGGATWTSLRGGPGQAPSGDSGGWRLSALDLSPWAGQTIRIRFYFDTIDPIANSYPGWFFDDVLVTAAGVPWLTVTPASGTVTAGVSQPLQANFNAGNLLGGDYRAQIQIASNDPFQPLVTVPAQLHVTGVPKIQVSMTNFDFGQLFVGAARAESLIVSNVGTDVLTVSGVDVTNPAFSVPAAGFTLPIGASWVLMVTYAPTSVGTSDGVLTIHSNDPGQGALAVTLHGQGVEAPNIAIWPPIYQEVMMPDEVLNETLMLKNLGGGPLTWNIGVSIGLGATAIEHQAAVRGPAPAGLKKEVALVPPPPPAPGELVRWNAAARAAAPTAGPGKSRPGQARAGASIASISSIASIASQPSLAGALAQLDSSYANVTAVIPNRYDFLEGVTGTSIVDGGQDMYDGGNFLQTELGGPVPYSNGVIAGHPAFGSGGVYFTRKYPGLFVLVADLHLVHTFTISGDLGADGAGAADGATLEADLGTTHYRGLVKRVYGANGKPSVNHLIILPDPGTTGHGYSINTNLDFDQVSGLDSQGRIYYLLFANQGGAYTDDVAMMDVMKAFVRSLFPSPPWLTVSPNAGVLPGHSSMNVGVLLDTHGLGLGSYAAALSVRSDDPDQPLISVPVNLTLGGPTAIEVGLVSSSAEAGVARVTWYAPQGAMSATVYRRTPDRDWDAVGPITADGRGYLVFEDKSVASGARYGYRLGITENGSQRFVAETWVDVPASAVLALEGLRPNPAVHDLMVAFSLPDASPASLALVDLAGRLVRSQEVGSQGAGRHVISLGRVGSLPPGVYMLRLQRGSRSLVAKGVIMP